MKNFLRLTIPLILAILIACLFAWNSIRSTQEEIVIGKEYVRCTKYNDDNPFEKEDCDTCVIVDKKNGWIQYKVIKGRNTGFIGSSREEYFSDDAKLYQENN